MSAQWNYFLAGALVVIFLNEVSMSELVLQGVEWNKEILKPFPR